MIDMLREWHLLKSQNNDGKDNDICEESMC